MIELKPCPRCGADPVLVSYELGNGYGAAVRCSGGCLAYFTGKSHDTKEEAIAKVVEKWKWRTAND